MRREDKDQLIYGFLSINAMLREDVKALRRAIEARRGEAKHNPNWRLQPRAPKGTAEGGRWVGDTSSFPKPRSRPKSGDPMDGADAATAAEGLLYEFTRKRYSRALEATQDPTQRIRIATDRAMLARQAFGRFSDQEVERIYAEEMRTRRGRIALGGTDLSERALRFRQTAGVLVGDGRNVVVIEYRGADGALAYIERVSQPGSHAEELAVAELRRLRVHLLDVTRVYTDRQPCSERCRPLLRPYRNARITWAVDWPDDNVGQTAANNALNRQIENYRRMESQNTLPISLWRYPNPAGNDVRPARRRRRR